MNQVIVSKHALALARRIPTESISIEVIPFETYGTPYGLFIPLSGSGYQFLRWVRKGMKDKLPSNAVAARIVHVSNDGEVLIGDASTFENYISLYPYCSEKFSLVNEDREISEGFTAVLSNCTNVAQAVALVESRNVIGMYDPNIVLVSHWVEYAKNCGYDKTFYRTTFVD